MVIDVEIVKGYTFLINFLITGKKRKEKKR